MRSVRRRVWAIVGIAALVPIGGFAYVSRHNVFLTNEEIDREAPRDLRYREPDARERNAWRALSGLQVRTVAGVGTYNHAGRDRWLPEEVEKFCELGLAAESSAVVHDQTYSRFIEPPSALVDMLAQSQGQNPRLFWRSAHALARWIRTTCQTRCETSRYWYDFERLNASAAAALLWYAENGAFSKTQLKELAEILPDEAVLVRSSQERLRLEFEQRVVNQLRPGKVELYLQPSAFSGGPKLAGRFDARETLRGEAAYVRETIQSMAKPLGSWDPRIEAREQERTRFLARLYWRKNGDPQWVVAAKSIESSIRFAIEPNARGWLIAFAPSSVTRRRHLAFERAVYGLIDGRLRALAGERVHPATDPFTGGEMIFDPVQARFWSEGTVTKDDGGVGDPSRPVILLPNMVSPSSPKMPGPRPSLRPFVANHFLSPY